MYNKLFYNTPPNEWLEGLPVGNGRLAAMVCGNAEKERLALNHEWLWEGKNRDREVESRAYLLKGVRELLLAGKYKEGTLAAGNAFGANGHHRIDSYQPAGDLYFEPDCGGNISNYYRELDMSKALVKVSYNIGKEEITRSVIAHPIYNLIIFRISSTGKISGTLRLARGYDPNCHISRGCDGSMLWMDGKIHNGLNFRVEAKVVIGSGFTRIIGDNDLKVEQTNELLIFINMGTSAKGEDPQAECSRYLIPDIPWCNILDSHINEYVKSYNRFRLEIPVQDDEITTDKRIRRVKGGGTDKVLPLLLFNYARYLLWSSSISGELPPNIKGKWNEDIKPYWDCDYHTDMNTQMCYWFAEQVSGMEGLTARLFSWLENISPHARKAAMALYGCRGVWFSHQHDCWNKSTPEAPYGYTVWIGAAPWFAQHLWWHFEYSQDIEFLKDHAYPFIKDVIEFYEDYLVDDGSGTLQIVPSQSPENYTVESGGPVTICKNSAMDIQLAMDVLKHGVQAAEALGIEEKSKKWKEMLERLPKMKVGSKGQLLEWNEEFEEADPGHRHLSHLFGLYPGEQITEYTPDLLNAARVSLDLRLASGGGLRGWTRAWAACCYARLGDSKKALGNLYAFITLFATEGLMEIHPFKSFLICGNFAVAASIIEMVFQSNNMEMDFLPALPMIWPDGKVTGMRSRGGFNVNIEWKDRELLKAEISTPVNRVCTIKQSHKKYHIVDSKSNIVECTPNGNLISFNAEAGEMYLVTLDK